MTRLQPSGPPADRIRDAVTRITLLWPVTQDPPRTRESNTRITYGPRLPGSTDALTTRVAATRDLGAIAWALRTRLNLTTVLNGLDIHDLTALIDTHADSLAILDSTAVHVIELHARALDELVKQTRPTRIRVGDCPRCTSGVLYAALRPEDPEQLGNVIACDNRATVPTSDPDVERWGDPVCSASWTSFEWRACWREVRAVHGPGGRRAGKPTRWQTYDPAGVGRLLDALRGRVAGRV